MKLLAVPITLAEVRHFVAERHRHHPQTVGGKFAIGCAQASPGPLNSDDLVREICGVAIVGRPIARRNADTWTAEVLRVCTDGTSNACSFLYAASWRACRAMGYLRLITYSLQTEPGTSLIAAGFRIVAEVQGKSWDMPSRPRVDRSPLQDKFRWEMSA